jgi:hypothetical protein
MIVLVVFAVIAAAIICGTFRPIRSVGLVEWLAVAASVVIPIALAWVLSGSPGNATGAFDRAKNDAAVHTSQILVVLQVVTLAFLVLRSFRRGGWSALFAAAGALLSLVVVALLGFATLDY